MKTKNMIWAALSMTAALVMTACTNDDNMAETSAAPQDEVKTIPYTVTVGQGGDAATTRATVESDMKTLKFAAGDKLYVTGTNISGTLDIQTGTGTASATFSGDLTYTGDGSPASDLSLAAILVGTNNKGVKITDGVINLFCPNDAYCADVNEAVEEYSALFGTSTYSEKSFTLTQMNAFLNFEITFVDGTTTGTTLSTVVSNNGSAIATANVTTTTESEKVVAKFVLPVPSDVITLSGATVKMGDKEAISFGASQTLEGKVYNVKRTYAGPTTVTWSPVNFNGSTYTQDGVTLTPSNGDAILGQNFYSYGDKTFTTTLGKFTKIEIVCTYSDAIDGWTKEKIGEYQPYPEDPDYWENIYKLTWTGNAESVTIQGKSVHNIQSITFTIQ